MYSLPDNKEIKEFVVDLDFIESVLSNDKIKHLKAA
jgi:hypothetical protein